MANAAASEATAIRPVILDLFPIPSGPGEASSDGSAAVRTGNPSTSEQLILRAPPERAQTPENQRGEHDERGADQQDVEQDLRLRDEDAADVVEGLTDLAGPG